MMLFHCLETSKHELTKNLSVSPHLFLSFLNDSLASYQIQPGRFWARYYSTWNLCLSIWLDYVLICHMEISWSPPKTNAKSNLSWENDRRVSLVKRYSLARRHAWIRVLLLHCRFSFSYSFKNNNKMSRERLRLVWRAWERGAKQSCCYNYCKLSKHNEQKKIAFMSPKMPNFGLSNPIHMDGMSLLDEKC